MVSQSLLRAKLSSVMKKRVNALRPIVPDDVLDIVRRAAARFASLHVDDGAERALVGTAAAGIEAGGAGGALARVAPQQRHRRAFDPRQVVHVIIERLERAGGGVAQTPVEPPFGFAGEQATAPCRGRVPNIGLASPPSIDRHAGDMKPADAHRDAGGRAMGGRYRARAGTGSIALRPEHHHAEAAASRNLAPVIALGWMRVLVSSIGVTSIVDVRRARGARRQSFASP